MSNISIVCKHPDDYFDHNARDNCNGHMIELKKSLELLSSKLVISNGLNKFTILESDIIFYIDFPEVRFKEIRKPNFFFSSLCMRITFMLNQLLNKKVILICSESPLFISKHKNIKRYLSKNVFVMGWMFDQIDISNKFVYQPITYPNFSKNLNVYLTKWQDKKNFLLDISKFRLTFLLHYGYRKRIDDLLFINKQKMGKVSLYGYGWNKFFKSSLYKCLKFSTKYNTLNKIYRGQVCNKSDIYKDYKFILCYENIQFPGYISNRVIEAIKYGIVPIYLGAPDISNNLPSKLYIDRNKFADNSELIQFLHSFDQDDYLEFLFERDKFLKDKTNIFSSEFFINNINKLMKNV